MELNSPFSATIETLRKIEDAMNNDTRVMTCSEAAYRLGKNLNTITRYIACGKLHKVSGNGVVGVRAKEVYSLLCQ